MRYAIFILGLLGCREASLPECQQGFDYRESGDASRVVTIVDDALDGPLVVQLIVPWETSRYPHGAPGAVFVHGGWTNDNVPISDDQAHLVEGTGIWAIYLNLPGGGGSSSSGGTDDNRGAGARQAIGAALRYGANLIEDNGSCTFEERLPTGLADERVLATFSNGGNLGWATLADTDVDLPEVHGIVSFETPASGQMALGEPGTANRDSPLHEPGSCSLDTDNALVCDYDYTGLSFDPLADDSTFGVLFIDTNDDDLYTDETDFPFGVVRAETDGEWVHSLQVVSAAEAIGLTLPARTNIENTAEFWRLREAPRAMPAAIERFPDLAGIATGTETDHVLAGASDHPHVTGMVAAMQAAGMGWTRLHPDRIYVESLATAEKDYADIDANLIISVGDENVPMEPEDDSGIRGTDYLTAGVLELLDRRWRDDWSDNLDEVLAP